MTELRQLLGALRPGADPAPIAPQPGLGDLDELLAGVTALQVSVTAEVDPAATSVPTATGLAAYRAVQEGLTNVVKHAGRLRPRPRAGGGRRPVRDRRRPAATRS